MIFPVLGVYREVHHGQLEAGHLSSTCSRCYCYRYRLAINYHSRMGDFCDALFTFICMGGSRHADGTDKAERRQCQSDFAEVFHDFPRARCLP